MNINKQPDIILNPVDGCEFVAIRLEQLCRIDRLVTIDGEVTNQRGSSQQLCESLFRRRSSTIPACR